MTDSALVVLVGAASTTSIAIFTGLFQLWRESRTRRWSLEDRRARAEEVKVALTQAATDLKSTSAASHAETKQLIREVGASANAAYSEANEVNQKIAGLYEAGLAEASRLAEIHGLADKKK